MPVKMKWNEHSEQNYDGSNEDFDLGQYLDDLRGVPRSTSDEPRDDEQQGDEWNSW
jgi:hypothetical protein